MAIYKNYTSFEINFNNNVLKKNKANIGKIIHQIDIADIKFKLDTFSLNKNILYHCNYLNFYGNIIFENNEEEKNIENYFSSYKYLNLKTYELRF